MTEILIAAAATFGLSTLVTSYDGPGEIFRKTRNKFDNSPLNCTVCLATWIAIPISIATEIGVIGYLATVGMTIVVERLT